MSKAIFVLGFTSLAFGATSLYFKDQASSERAQVEALQARVGEIEKLRAAPPPPMPPPDVVTDTPVPPPPPAGTAIAPLPASAATGLRTGFIAAPFGGDMRDRTRKLLQDPEYREAMRMQQKVMLPERYPDLAAALHLAPEQQDKLLDVLADQQMRQMANTPPFRFNGQQPDQAAIREWQEQMQKQQRENDAEIATVLGSGGAQEWKDYQNSLGARMQVKQLKSSLDSGAEPLRDDQVQSLVTALSTENQRRMTEYASNPPAPFTKRLDPTADRAAMFEQSLQQTEQNNKRLHDTVAPYLTPSQLASFDAAQNRQLEMQRASIKMMRAQSEADARDGVQSNGNFTSVGGSNVIYQPEPR
jgi:phage terminase small subunit